MVLEGSVRKQGDKVRITAQLIDAKTGFHVWSQTYDRKLEDIFAIQDEIAKAIGDELKVKIGAVDKQGDRGRGTRNLKAYDLYLRGMALWHMRREKELWEAVALFEKAAAMDPEFAQAYSGLALAYTILPAYSTRMSGPEALARSIDAGLARAGARPAPARTLHRFGQRLRDQPAAQDRSRTADSRHRPAAVICDGPPVARQHTDVQWGPGGRTRARWSGPARSIPVRW